MITRVKKTIDDRIAQLLKEKTDEISHKDFENTRNDAAMKHAGDSKPMVAEEIQKEVMKKVYGASTNQ